MNNLFFVLQTFFIIGYEYLLYSINIYSFDVYFERTASKLSKQNILFIKLFQAISSNKHQSFLLKYADNVPYTATDVDLNCLNEVCKEYNIELENDFIRSGIISLVFKGIRNNDNKEVIVKIKRKNIEEKMKESIEQLMFFANIMSFFTNINIREIIIKNSELLYNQLDFNKEVNNLIIMKNNCKNIKFVKIPDVYENISEKYSNNVIIMEYIDGMKINEIEEKEKPIYAKQIIKFGLATSMLHGVIHGDLHCGNILFIKELEKESELEKEKEKESFKIGIIDFGIIYHLNNTFKNNVFDFLSEIHESDIATSTNKLLKSGIIEPIDFLETISDESREKIVKIISEIIRNFISSSIHYNYKLNQKTIYSFFSKLKECVDLNKNNIRFSDEFIKLQLILSMSVDITFTLCNDDYLKIFDEVFDELFIL
jgi:predicted unusual protein kinase regulating ubiquinone biosynthesis (AarF/ABC1/UbiB family)